MTLIVCVKAHGGVVISADSRLTSDASTCDNEKVNLKYFRSDGGKKLFGLRSNPHIGIGFVGAMSLGSANLLPTDLLIQEFEECLEGTNAADASVEVIANHLQGFLRRMHQPQNWAMWAVVVGFGPGDDWGRFFEFEVPSEAAPREVGQALAAFWWRWGDAERCDWIMKNLEPQYDSMSLQDCVTLVAALPQTVALLESVTSGRHSIGGPIEVALITRGEGLQWVNKKTVHWTEVVF